MNFENSVSEEGNKKLLSKKGRETVHLHILHAIPSFHKL